MSDRSRRVVHFGIDGGSFRILDALADRGIMPEYAAMCADGGRAVLRSTTPWFTVPAWITWMTGVSPERHGLIYWTASSARDHWERRAPTRRFVAHTDVRHPTVFQMLSDSGVRVASVNMPVTFPPPVVDGVVVSGFLAPTDTSRAAYPPGFLRGYPDYRVDMEEGPPEVMGRAGGAASLSGDDKVVAYAQRLTRMAEARHRLTLDLLADDFGLTSVVYVGADRLSHVAWPQVESVLHGAATTPVERAVADYYATLDRLLGETRRACGDGLLIVSSDHGQGPPPRRLLAPNAWLSQRGWLAVRSQRARRAAHLIPWSGLRRRIWTVWRKLRNIPEGSTPFVDWKRTRGYALRVPQCSMFGVAVRGDRSLQEEVAAGLAQIEDPDTGMNPVTHVVFADDVCKEEAARERYPELLVFLRPEYGAVSAFEAPVVRAARPGPDGHHEPEGILLAVGEGVVEGDHGEAQIADIAPTLLTALGLEASERLDGRPIPWLTAAGDEQLRPVGGRSDQETDQGLTPRDEEMVAEHLRNLGYID